MCACSVRLNERLQRGVGDNKKLAYLIDLKTVAVGKTVDKEDEHLNLLYFVWKKLLIPRVFF